jgi:hypothetical protein
MIASDKGDIDAAVSKFQRYQKLAGVDTSRDISLAFVTAAAKVSDRTAAVRHLKNALKHYPSNHKAFFTLLSLTEDWELCKDAINDDILRTREDRVVIENICYKLSKLEELKTILVKKVQSGGAHPAPYLFLAAYYKKMGELSSAQGLIKDYIIRNSAAPAVKKNYSGIMNDTFLETLFRSDKFYQCSACGSEFVDYAEICQNCGEAGTINYKLT